MGSGESRIDPETLPHRVVSLPPFVGSSFLKTQVIFASHLMPHQAGITNPMTNHTEASSHCSNKGIKKYDDPNEMDSSTLSAPSTITVITNRDQLCQNRPHHRRRSLVPSASIQFRDNRCCKNPLRPLTSTPIEADENQAETTVQPITVEDPLGTVALPPFRRWQIFPGNNRFYCDGRIITGPDRLTFYLSFALLNLVFGLFAGFVIPSQEEKLTISLSVVTLILYVFCTSSMLYSAFIDPGIVPRPSRDQVEILMKKYASSVHPNGVLPFIRETISPSKEIIRRWCTTCLHYKPPRSTHCRQCNNCVERFDHHCPFIGNCVGQRNYPSFFVFIVSIVISGIFVALMCIADVSLKCSKSDNIIETLKTGPVVGAIFTGLIAIVSFVPVMILLYLHVELVTSDLTTNEDTKRTYGNHNPFDRKNRWKNCTHVLCDPRLPSMINRREFATQDWLASLEHSEEVKSALLKKFGRPPNSDAGAKTGSSTLTKAVLPDNKGENGNAKNKGFVFLHQKSEPDIARKTGKKTQEAQELGANLSTQGAAGDSQHDQIVPTASLNYFNDRKNLGNDTLVQNMEAFYHPHQHPDWYFVNLLIRKRMLGTAAGYANSQYDLGSCEGNLSTWNSKKRIGPTYQNHHV